MSARDDRGVAPLPRLLAAYAGRRAALHRLIWAYDARLADVVRTTREPMIGRMRLTWWHEALTDEQGAKGRGEPLVTALRGALMPAQGVGGLLQMIDGWEALLDPPPLADDALLAFAAGRGGGLFRALAGEPDDLPEVVERAGRLWALWDLSGHVGDPGTAKRAVALAQDCLPAADARWRREWKPLRIAAALAAQDVRAGRLASAEMTPQLYMRLLKAAVFGR